MSVTLYVGGLPADIEQDDLKAEFLRFGTVLDVQLERRYGGTSSSTFALVRMSSEREAQEAFRAARDYMLDGHALTLVLLKNDSPGLLGAGPTRA